jgi:hypothetical protein
MAGRGTWLQAMQASICYGDKSIIYNAVSYCVPVRNIFEGGITFRPTCQSLG